MQKPIKMVDGFSESAWKSLAVKAIRIGWPEGLRQAAYRLSPGTMRALLYVGLFEDTFPAESEVQEALKEAEALDLEAVCRRDTHHHRGWTREFCRLEPQAVRIAKENPSYVDQLTRRELNRWLPPRARNVFWTWTKIRPNDPGLQRTVDQTPWRGMPVLVLDEHTLEGRRMRQKSTFVSGHYERHLELSVSVAEGGWTAIRQRFHAGRVLDTPQVQEQQSLL